MAREGKRRVKLWQVALAIPVVCAVGGYGASAVAEGRARAEARAELAKLKAMGIPIDAAGLVRSVPPERNAAHLLDQARTSLKSIGKVKSMTFRAKGLKPEDREEFHAQIIAQQPTLDLIRRAAEKPDCYWIRNWDEGFRLMFPEYADMKTFVKLAAGKAYLEAQAGNFEASMEWLSAGRRLAAFCREPVLISSLVAVACEAIVQAEFAEQLRDHGMQPEFRAVAAKFLAEDVPLPSLKEGFKGEVFAIRSAMAMIARGDKDILQAYGISGENADFDTRVRLTSLRYPYVQAAVEARVLKTYRLAFKAMGEGGWRKEMEASKVMDRYQMSDTSWVGRLASDFFPVFMGAGSSFVRLEAMRRMGKVALELFETRAKTGGFPKNLKSAILDPYTDRSFIYVPTEDSFRLYSVGPNGKDDRSSAKSGPRTDDVFFGYDKH